MRTIDRLIEYVREADYLSVVDKELLVARIEVTPTLEERGEAVSRLRERGEYP